MLVMKRFVDIARPNLDFLVPMISCGANVVLKGVFPHVVRKCMSPPPGSKSIILGLKLEGQAGAALPGSERQGRFKP